MRGRAKKKAARGPLVGMLASPCGVWVRVETVSERAGWRVLMAGATRRAMGLAATFGQSARRAACGCGGSCPDCGPALVDCGPGGEWAL